MDVRLSNLLNSAERMLRDKNSTPADSKTTGKEAGWTAPPVQDTAEFTNQLTGKFQTIQTKLSELQSQLTKEQMRQAVLEEKQPKPDELINVLFGKEPLFPELQGSASVNLEDLKKTSQSNVDDLEKQIRAKEVENENVVALGMIHNSGEFSKALKDLGSVTFRPLNENSVQKLIQ
ncbi:MAG: hypothetical protein GW938_04325 [Leptospira sp.]|jgi:hypothetical protein|nr:hypothetical protein [Leptospira sp.]NCS92365.1 hypothetical protein [Leptospira sp.]